MAQGDLPWRRHRRNPEDRPHIAPCTLTQWAFRESGPRPAGGLVPRYNRVRSCEPPRCGDRSGQAQPAILAGSYPADVDGSWA